MTDITVKSETVLFETGIVQITEKEGKLNICEIFLSRLLWLCHDKSNTKKIFIFLKLSDLRRSPP